jgi:2-polyprenyl-3-methyl-5-hydroxy-6-metoxy-1,4-benzoquinol methylase
MTKISWRRKQARVDCRVCGFSGQGQQVLNLVNSAGMKLAPIECPQCRSLHIVDTPIEFSQSQFEVEAYATVNAGIDSIASMVSSMPADSVTNFVDIGCGFGFSLALARDLYGWNVSGFEPSPLGIAGASTWGLDIRNEYFTPESSLTDAPDFILSSEVIEHVPEPTEFLTTIRDQMKPDAVLMLSTPNRAVVSQESPAGVVESALSPGFHVFVASAQGMRTLLRRAGFEHIRVEERGESLFIGASRSGPALDKLVFRDIPRTSLEDWYRRARQRVELGTSLHLSLSRRLFDSYVATGKLAEARVLRNELATEFKAVFGTDDFESLVQNQNIGPDSFALPVIASLSYGDGILALLGDGDALRAAEAFGMSISATDAWHALGGPPHLALLNMSREAFLNRLVALARVRPADAEREALSSEDAHEALSYDYILARVAVEGITSGHADQLTKLIAECRSRVDELCDSTESTHRTAAQDALFMIAGVFERSGNLALATKLYEQCVRHCLEEPLVSRHEINLVRHATEALVRLGAQAPAPQTGALLAKVTVGDPLPDVFFGADTFWRDASGVFIEGWAHLGAIPVSGITVSHGSVTVEARTKLRPDLHVVYGDLPANSSNGFRAYIPQGRGEHLDITLTSKKGNMVVRWRMPHETLPRVAGAPIADAASSGGPSHATLGESVWDEADGFRTLIRTTLAEAVDGPVLAIGIRTDNNEQLAATRALFGGREIISLDIHSGNGVDVVGDIHDVQSIFADAQFACVYSDSVIEHLAMPWVAALEMLRVLKPGGVLAHSIPWVWPSHSQPNDFFRMSAEGLHNLFSPQIGCRTIQTGEGALARVVPEPSWRTGLYEDMPSLVSPSMTWIVSQKVSDAASAAHWPYDSEQGRIQAAEYPEGGINRDWTQR